MKQGNKEKIQVYLTKKQMEFVKEVMEKRDLTKPEAVRRIFEDYMDLLEEQKDK